MLIVMMIVKILLINDSGDLGDSGGGRIWALYSKVSQIPNEQKKEKKNDSISMHGNSVQTGYITLNLVVAFFST